MTYQIPKHLNDKCHTIIHTAALSVGATALVPVPVPNASVIFTTDIAMIIALGNVFDICITRPQALEITKAAVTAQAGKLIAGQISKFIPIFGSGVNAVIASGFTEKLGWDVANIFYRESINKNTSSKSV